MAASTAHRVYLERFQWPLLAALCCFLAEFFIGTRKRMRRAAEAPMSRNAIRFANRRPKFAARTAAAALILAMFAWPGFVQASPQSAERAYKKGDYTAAEQQYQAAVAKAPATAELDFNLGWPVTRRRCSTRPPKRCKKSLKTDQLSLQQETYYNLGNTQYRMGQKTEKTNPKQTIPVWKQAIQSYDAALQLKPDDADSQYNRDLVKKKLEKLQQQQQKQSKDNKDQKGNKNKTKRSKINQSKIPRTRTRKARVSRSRIRRARTRRIRASQSRIRRARTRRIKVRRSRIRRARTRRIRVRRSRIKRVRIKRVKDNSSRQASSRINPSRTPAKTSKPRPASNRRRLNPTARKRPMPSRRKPVQKNQPKPRPFPAK